VATVFTDTFTVEFKQLSQKDRARRPGRRPTAKSEEFRSNGGYAS
jgi:hypothetical protein